MWWIWKMVSELRGKVYVVSFKRFESKSEWMWGWNLWKFVSDLTNMIDNKSFNRLKSKIIILFL